MRVLVEVFMFVLLIWFLLWRITFAFGTLFIDCLEFDDRIF